MRILEPVFFFGRFGTLSMVYRDVEFPLPWESGFLFVEIFVFGWTVSGFLCPGVRGPEDTAKAIHS